MNKLWVLVLEVRERDITVLTEAGDFLDVPITSPAPRKGQRIWVEAPGQKRARPSAPLWFGLVAAAVLALAFLAPLKGPEPPPLIVASTVTIDINPSFLVNLDDQFRTVDAVPLNEQARSLKLPQPGTPALAALTEILSAARERGYLNEDSVMVYSSWSRPGAGPSPEAQTIISEAINRIGFRGQFIALEATSNQVERARSLGVSVNRIIIVDRARALGVAQDLSPSMRNLRHGLQAIGLLPPAPVTPRPEFRDPVPEPAAPKPTTPQPPAPQPPAPQPPTAQPPAAQPPATQPPVLQPPVGNDSVAPPQPPATQPPPTETEPAQLPGPSLNPVPPSPPSSGAGTGSGAR